MLAIPAHSVRRLLLTGLVLGSTLLGCTLNLGSEPGNTDSAPSTGSGESVATGAAPSVRIVDPASGATVAANQRVDLTVETDTTATRFQLTVSGQVASTKALPADQAGPTSAILSWTPRREGDYNLQVTAYNGVLAGQPAAILLTVSGTAGGGAESGTTCTGRALVSQLNYRDGPGTRHTKLGKFQTGETATVLGRNSEGTWLKVRRMNMQEVWVINNPQWYETEGQCGTLPVME